MTTTDLTGAPAMFVDRAARLLDDAAGDWSLSRRTVLLILISPLMIALAGFTLAIANRHWYSWFTREDSLAENIQMCLLLFAIVGSVVIALRHLRARRTLIAVLFASFAVGLVFVAGEEISWGQRIFGFATPEELREANRQHEANLHNIYAVESDVHLAELVVGFIGSVVPFWSMTSLLSAHRRTLCYIIPHYTIAPCFIVFFAWRFAKAFLIPHRWYPFATARYSEVAELVLYLSFALFVWFELRRTAIERNRAPV